MQTVIISLGLFCVGLAVGKYVRTLDLTAITLNKIKKDIENAESYGKVSGKDTRYVEDIYEIIDKYLGKTSANDER